MSVQQAEKYFNKQHTSAAKPKQFTEAEIRMIQQQRHKLLMNGFSRRSNSMRHSFHAGSHYKNGSFLHYLSLTNFDSTFFVVVFDFMIAIFMIFSNKNTLNNSIKMFHQERTHH